MPDLTTKIHNQMLERSHKLGLHEGSQAGIYGDHWGDPQTNPMIRWIRDNCLLRHVSPDKVVCEIGPGGGRWTRYLLGCKKVFAVDYYPELLDQLFSSFRSPVLERVENNGTDFPGVPENSCDLVFSFGVFVHLDFDIIDKYLENIRKVVTPSGDVVIQYSDKRKEQAKKNPGFANNDPERMRAAIIKHGYTILEEVNDLLPHSCVVRFTPQTIPYHRPNPAHDQQ